MWDIIKNFFGGWKTWFIVTFLGSIFGGLWNFFVDILHSLLMKSLSLITSIGGVNPVTLQFQGLAAYFSECFRFSECLYVILSAILIKWMFRKIPFIRW